MDGGDGAADGKETDEGQVDQQGGPAVIEYKRDDKVLDLPNPEVGRWTATVAGAEVCEVEVSVEIIDTWGRLCALDVAHMLPEGCDPVVREWLETGDEGLRDAAEDAADTATEDAHLAVGATVKTVGLSAWTAGVVVPSVGVTSWVMAAAGGAAAAACWAAAGRAGSAAWSAARAAATARAGLLGYEREVVFDVIRTTQRAHLHRLIWISHGETLTTRARVELARDLRYRGEEEAAAAVLPIDLREVSR